MPVLRCAIVFGALCLVGASTGAIAAPAGTRKGSTKIAIKYLFRQPDASASATIVGDDGALLENYDSYSLVAAPTGNVGRIEARAAAAGRSVEVHDEYDILGLPGGALDTRLGVLPPLGADLIPQYTKGSAGLYVLQFLGPPKSDWLNDVAKAGGILIAPIPVNGYLAAFTPEVSTRIAALREVQFLGMYQPFQKAALVDRTAAEQQDIVVQLADAPGSEETIKQITVRAGALKETKNAGGHYLSGRFHSEDITPLLAMPLVVGVHRLTALQPSDERQAMSLTTNLTTSNGNTIPTGAGTYAQWLTGSTGCSVCGNAQQAREKFQLVQ